MGETSTTRYRGGMALVPHETSEPPGIELRGHNGSIWIPAAGGQELAACLQRAGIAGFHGIDTPDAVVPWCVRAGVAFETRWSGGSIRRGHPLPSTVDDPRLLLEFWDSASDLFGFRFSEVYDPAGPGQRALELDTGRRAIALLGGDEAGVVAVFRARIAAGELGPHLPPGANRAAVSTWILAAGLPRRLRERPAPAAEALPAARTERLLKVHRAGPDCVFALTLVVDPERGITFREAYDYLPRPGDPGREYSYGVRTPYTSIDRLNEALDAPAAGDPPARLARAFRDLLARGVIGDGLALRAARDRVAELFTSAGVPTEPADWHWVNSE
jgi:hypothetical protein